MIIEMGAKLRFASAVLLLLCLACAGSKSVLPAAPRKPVVAKKDWTLLVYMAADYDDLKPYAYLNLYEMEQALASTAQAGMPSRAEVLVQLDTPGLQGLRRMRIVPATEPYNHALTQEYFASRCESDLHSPVVALLDEPQQESAAQAALHLKDFLHWGIRNYPAQHYMVIVWGHGKGWAAAQSANAAANDGRLRGIAADKTQGTYLDTPLLHKTLQAVINEDLGGQPLDIYASDACLMQSIEVATELFDVARFVIGSVQIQAFSGLPYRQLLQAIQQFGVPLKSDGAVHRQKDEAFELARLLPALANEALHGDGLQARLTSEAVHSFTLSALRTSELVGSLVPALHGLGQELRATLDGNPLRAVQLGQRILTMTSFLGGPTDLGYFLERFKDGLRQSGWCRLVLLDGEETTQCSDRQVTALLVALVSAQQALSRTVVGLAYGDDYKPANNPARMLGFSGVSIWLPRTPSDYQNRIDDYSSSLFYRAPSPWGQWLRQIFAPH